MEKKQIIEIIKGMIAVYKMDLKDKEFMAIKCTHKHIAKTNIRTMKQIVELLND